MAQLRAVAAIALIFLASCRSPTAPEEPIGTSGSIPDAAAAIVDPVNAERARAGLPALRADSRLIRAAQLHADLLAAARQLAHTLPVARYPRL